MYAPKGIEKHVDLAINEAVLDLLNSGDNFLPVYCDQHPNDLVSWYSTKSKQLISNQALFQQPDLITSSAPINKLYLDHFFRTAKSSLFELNQQILQTMDQVVSYLEDSLPAMKASSFLKIVSQIKRFCDLAKDIKEEKKD